MATSKALLSIKPISSHLQTTERNPIMAHLPNPILETKLLPKKTLTSDNYPFTQDEKTQIISLYRKKFAEMSPALLDIIKSEKDVLEILEKKDKTPEDIEELRGRCEKLAKAINRFEDMLWAETRKVNAGKWDRENIPVENTEKIIFKKNDARQDLDIEFSFNAGANYTFNNINPIAFTVTLFIKHYSIKYEFYADLIREGIRRTEAAVDFLQNADESKVIAKKLIQGINAPFFLILDPNKVI